MPAHTHAQDGTSGSTSPCFRIGAVPTNRTIQGLDADLEDGFVVVENTATSSKVNAMRGKPWVLAAALMSCALFWSSPPAQAQFTQQGPKLVGSGAVNGSSGANQGGSVALSADGNTAIVGGYGDNNGAGAAWVFTRSGGVWTQLRIEAGRQRRCQW